MPTEDFAPPTSGQQRVVIVGAGFAGIEAARQLAITDFNVTLIDVHNFHTFQPLLYQVATAGLDPADVAFPVRAIFPGAANITVHRGRVARIDMAAHSVVLSDASEIPYDTLIVGTGATTSFLSIEGAADYAKPLYTLRDARALRNALLKLLEAVDAQGDANHALTIVVIGGGATGVEMAGATVELLDISVQRDRMRFDRDRTKVILIDVADRLLTAFGERTSQYALDEVVSRGIDVRLGTAVSAVSDQAVHLSNGSSIPADLVIWAGGVTVNGTLAASLPGERLKGGRVEVRHDLSLPGHPEIFVIGDAAAIPLGPKTNELAPQLAQVAMQSGRHAALELLARRTGSPVEPFSYKDKGMMATIGRRAAVAEIEWPSILRGLILKGTLGWFAWLGLHLVYLVGVRNRVVVLCNWFWRYVGWSAGPRIIVEDDAPE